MDKTHSHSRRCTCFSHCSNIKSKEVARYKTVNWVWTKKHDIAVFGAAFLPTDIASLIKQFSYHVKVPVPLLAPKLCSETYYADLSELLRKPLCRAWYDQHFGMDQPIISTNLYSSDNVNISDVFDSRIDDFLPALTLQRFSDRINDKNQPHYVRTVFADSCRFTHDLKPIKMSELRTNNKRASSAKMHVLMVNSRDCANVVNTFCQQIWMRHQSVKHVVIFQYDQCTDVKNKLIGDVASYWNVPYVTCHNDLNLFFRFITKYYWFRCV